MLNRITLKNFRKHTDSSFDLRAGLSVLRGGNEQGKSTTLEAIAYALFGASALRDSLEDVVTWGCAANTLKVELDMGVDNVTYTIKRGKSGAELNADGVMVTGQKEVSAYVAKLLKVDAGAAARLTLSNQLEIRGALEAGTKATTELIERLAEFDQIDKLLELMQEKLTLGNSATVEAHIEHAERDLQAATEAAVPYDSASAQARIGAAHVARATATTNVEGLEAAERVAQENHSAVREAAARRSTLEQGVSTAQRALERARAAVQAITLPEQPTNVDAAVEALQQRIANAEHSAHLLAQRERVKPFESRAEGAQTVKGCVDDLKKGLETAQADVTTYSNSVVRLEGEIKLLRAQLTHGSCTFCGKDFSGVPEVAARNAETQAKLNAAEVQKSDDLVHAEGARARLAALKAVETAQRAVQSAYEASGGNAIFTEDGWLPLTLTWVGPDIEDADDIPSLRKQIRDLRNAQDTYTTAFAEQQRAAAAVMAAEAGLKDAQAALSGCPEVSTQATQTALEAAQSAAREARRALTAAQAEVDASERAARDLAAAYDRAVAAKEGAEARLANLRKDLEDLEFNNTLVKRVRQCRPVIADKLWGIVLAAVSSYFSEIRGVKSRVTKDGSGFRVDDHAVSSMSGSTLDALGLAIRVALVRTFLPSAPFLILDEPSAAMDADRTGNMLGFLSSCGFQQILLVTHEEVSSDIADHIITL